MNIFRSVLNVAIMSTIFLSVCSDKPFDTVLLNGDKISAEDTEIINKRIKNSDAILLVYTTEGFKNSGVILTEKKIVNYSKDSLDSEIFSEIFDMAHSNPMDTISNAKITIYRKNDTKFICLFMPNSEHDETFFNLLRTTWRSSISLRKS